MPSARSTRGFQSSSTRAAAGSQTQSAVSHPRPGCAPARVAIGRPVTDPAARAEVARAWGKTALPGTPGRDTEAILAAAAHGELGALVVAGVDPADLPDPRTAQAAIEMLLARLDGEPEPAPTYVKATLHVRASTRGAGSA